MPTQHSTAPVLELLQLCRDLVDVHFEPEDVVVAAHSINDVVVQAVQLLQQVEFLLDLQQLRVLRDLQAKELLATSVGDVFAVQGVKVVLAYQQPL